MNKVESAVSSAAEKTFQDLCFLFPAPEFTLESRDLLNLQVRLEKDDWHIVFWATNVTDEEFIGAIQNNGALRYAAPPRQMGIRFGRSL